MNDVDRAKPQKLLTFSSGGWVLVLSGVFVLVAAGIVLWPLYQTGFHPAVGDGKNVESYGFDLSRLTVARGKLIASGKAKDEIRAIPQALVETASPEDVVLMNKNEHIHYIIPSDRVIGVTINGESRAYPVRMLNLHELVNDTLGGVPIAVTWSSLCDSAVVFDRRVRDGDTAKSAPEFGVSGLLVNSNSVYFDRAGEAKEESLWLQLSFRAIAGPAAGRKMALVPYELVTWKAWSEGHAGTRVLLGLRTLKQAYGDAQDPFNNYMQSNELKFPVEPMWSDAGVRRKTGVVASSFDKGEHWKVVAAEKAGARAEGEERLCAFVFAWYAQHQSDTDYSGIK